MDGRHVASLKTSIRKLSVWESWHFTGHAPQLLPFAPLPWLRAAPELNWRAAPLTPPRPKGATNPVAPKWLCGLWCRCRGSGCEGRWASGASEEGRGGACARAPPSTGSGSVGWAVLVALVGMMIGAGGKAAALLAG
jgi:hypothetical protein